MEKLIEIFFAVNKDRNIRGHELSSTYIIKGAVYRVHIRMFSISYKNVNEWIRFYHYVLIAWVLVVVCLKIKYTSEWRNTLR